MPHTIDLSIVIPLFNEDESLNELCEWIRRVVVEKKYSYEILLVDDGSSDSSWQVIQKLSDQDENIRGIRFNRNYGKSAALDTGFAVCRGRVIITMDADLQDSPDEIPELFDMITNKGYDLVSGWKKKRHDPISKTAPSKVFNFFTRMISGVKLNDFNCGLKAYKKEVVENISVYGEMHRYIPVIANWAGFSKIGEKVVSHQPRKYGVTKFGLERFINGFLDLLSITFVSRFKRKPMHFFGLLGTVSFLLGFVFTVKIFWDKLYALYYLQVLPDRDITDQPLFYLALVALIVGVQLFLAGFLAEMIALKSHSKNDYVVIDRTNHN